MSLSTACALVVLFLGATGTAISGVLSDATIEAFSSTQTIPLGKSVVLVCKAPGESSTLSYQWSCPGGNCDVSTNVSETPRSRIVNENTLTVTVVNASADAGEYTCTVTGGDSTETASYTLDVEAGVVVYHQQDRAPLVVLPNGSVVTNPDGLSSSKAPFIIIELLCSGTASGEANLTWFGPDRHKVLVNRIDLSHAHQFEGQLNVPDVSRHSLINYTNINGIYMCTIGNQRTTVGLFLTENKELEGTYNGTVSNLTSTQTSSSSVRLSWDQLTAADDEGLTTVGYFLSYGRVDHDVVEHVVVEGGSTTSVDLTNLQPGVEYEATVRGRFSQNGTDRRVSLTAATSWKIIITFSDSLAPAAPTSTLNYDISRSRTSSQISTYTLDLTTSSFAVLPSSSESDHEVTFSSAIRITVSTFVPSMVLLSSSEMMPTSTSAASAEMTIVSLSSPVATATLHSSVVKSPVNVAASIEEAVTATSVRQPSSSATQTINISTSIYPTSNSNSVVLISSSYSSIPSSSLQHLMSTQSPNSATLSSKFPTDKLSHSNPTSISITTSSHQSSSHSVEQMVPIATNTHSLLSMTSLSPYRTTSFAQTISISASSSPFPGKENETDSLSGAFIIGVSVGIVAVILVILAVVIFIIVLAVIFGAKKSTHSRRALRYSRENMYWSTKDTKL